jgi:hypothetical protein
MGGMDKLCLSVGSAGKTTDKQVCPCHPKSDTFLIEMALSLVHISHLAGISAEAFAQKDTSFDAK